MPRSITAHTKQLLLLIIDQLKAASFNLDTEAIAFGMGPKCNKRAIQHRINTLRKLNEEAHPASTEEASEATSSPMKRKPGRPRNTPNKKKTKAQDTTEEDEEVLLGVVVQGDHHDGN
ncbi:hypothetical protein N7508_009024 [Penicillium antarcticum]|uniref:uncharacterized protein n=1 Tax=Penicillium antarcticum TaxID=416450 RepID=UPI0023879FBE|nr:uncharacterized protein N7508_009024 [Penicillium antarcticum]KAJ5294203.1 hypothetical protein N7508_009024 [Penicillium antarcticum]